ncbi:CHAT domain-containing protein [Sulfidibacter corallicola]|uniref:CHAT domain-containing protein n=1 Tax=Sulfidibacter corallicola TaxID=2818388 RepID=A0A8A4TLV4_SULCO|nr:CHAT domain-containing tetratricopeptide repeat protein [Sulfidibacter corallicola]QTD50540.1 CHAT domain-containing protein [Sulfidibacter corallicola]
MRFRATYYVCVISLFLFATSCSDTGASRQLSDHLGEIVQIQPGKVHRFRIELKADEVVALEIEQVRADVSATWHGGNTEISMDGWFGPMDTEWLCVKAATTGAHFLEIEGLSQANDTGGYRLRIERHPAPDERHRLAARVFEVVAKARHIALDEQKESAPPSLKEMERLESKLPELSLRLQALYWETRSRLDGLTHQNERARISANRASEFYAAAGLLAPAAYNAHRQARIARNLGRHGESRSAIEQAQQLARQSDDPALVGRIRTRKGFELLKRGEMQQAEIAMRSALSGLVGVDDWAAQATQHDELGILLTMLARTEEARRHFDKAFELWHRLGHARNAQLTKSEIAWTHYVDGRTSESIPQLREVIEALTTMNEHVRAARLHDRLGTMWVQNGGAKKSEAAYLTALERGGLNTLGRAAVLSNLARLYLRDQQRTEEALEALTEAEAHYRQAGEGLNLCEILFLHAQALEMQGNHESAMQRAEESVDLLRELRHKLTATDMALSFMSARGHYLDLYLDLLYRFHQLDPARGFHEEALKVFETFQAQYLSLDLKRRIEAHRFPEHLRRELGALSHEIDALKTELRQGDEDEHQQTARHRRLSHLLREKSQLRAAGVELGQISDFWTDAIELADMQSLLPSGDGLLLVYHLGEKHSYLWALDGQGLQMHRLEPRERIFDALNKYLTDLPSDDPEYQENARILGQFLLGPVADRLANRRILVVRDDQLNHLPFASLIPPGGEDPLVVTAALTMLPSARFGVQLRRWSERRQMAPCDLLMFADPLYRASSKSAAHQRSRTGQAPIRGQHRSEDRARFKNLAHAEAEAAQICALFDSGLTDRYQQAEANLTQLKSLDLSHYRILHFATHGIEIDQGLTDGFFDAQGAAFTGLSLAHVDPSGRDLPEKNWHLHNVADLRLNADLVALSACSTGLGGVSQGEGSRGLDECMLGAGADRVLASLWKVRDRTSQLLMTEFYQAFIEEGLPADQALRQAQLTLRSQPENEAPSDWAAFELSGNPAPLDVRYGSSIEED